MSGATPTYHYYIQDHQENNRVVFNQNGTIEQTNHYYPFGMTFGEGVDNAGTALSVMSVGWDMYNTYPEN